MPTEQVIREAYLPYAPQPDPATPRPLAAILEDLHRPIHESFLQTKTKKGTEITFISWHTAVRILDRYAPGWHYPAPQIAMADGQVVVSVQIGIPTSDQGIVWRGATGWDEDEEKAYGDASDRAESQALRRACAKFGLALYLYYEKGAHGPTQQQRPQKQATAQNGSQRPVAANPSAGGNGPAQATPVAAPTTPPRGVNEAAPADEGQIQQIRGLTRRAGLTPDQLLDRLKLQSLTLLTAEQADKTLAWLTDRAHKREGTDGRPVAVAS